jgi:Vacuolar protein sorting-associated protein 62
MPSLLSLLLGSVLALTPAQLLDRHRPVVVLHPQERSAPTSVEGFLADADLVGGRYDMRVCSARDGLTALQCYDDADEPAPPVVYGTTFRRGGRIALQYWLFHAFDIWSPLVPQSPDYWKAHEGDWEAVTVLLDPRGRPVEVGTSRHCGGARQAWPKVEKQGARPVVYSALGSHALYFRPGRYRQDEGCWPNEAVLVFKAYKVPILDHVARGRALSPRVLPVTRASPAWMRFTGSFGETQYMHFPQATLAFGSGPHGPVSHDLWREPFGTPARWKLG